VTVVSALTKGAWALRHVPNLSFVRPDSWMR
jgi:hypothetical protein